MLIKCHGLIAEPLITIIILIFLMRSESAPAGESLGKPPKIQDVSFKRDEAMREAVIGFTYLFSDTKMHLQRIYKVCLSWDRIPISKPVFLTLSNLIALLVHLIF